MVGFRDFNETFEADSMVSLRPRKPVHIVAVYYIDLSTICRVVYPDWFNTDPDPGFLLNPDPDPVPDLDPVPDPVPDLVLDPDPS
jgi:hypothetical protein